MKLFRPAPNRSRAQNLLWTAAQCAVVWGTTLVVLPLLIVELERRLGVHGFRFRAQTVVAIALFMAASALNLATGAVLAVIGRGTPLPLASPQSLVLTGPYRYVRNPMAIAGISQGIAVAIWLGSWTVLAYAFAGAVFWHVVLRPAEEADLVSRFGAEYEAYRRAIPLWYPGFGRSRSVDPAIALKAE
jgi:protein-S-isoprenylcysteine O-methyltransferase Ste14